MIKRVWRVVLKCGKGITMVVGDETPINKDEAPKLARQRFFDDVLTVE